MQCPHLYCAPLQFVPKTKQGVDGAILSTAPEISASASQVRSSPMHTHLSKTAIGVVINLTHGEGLIQSVFFRRLIATCFYVFFSLLLDKAKSSIHVWSASDS